MATEHQPTNEAERIFQKRNPAIKVSISDILNGRFVREEGLNLSYVETNHGEKISRANIISGVVAKDASQASPSIYIDDGTGRITVRSFDRPDIFDKVDIGDLVIVIGKPREFSNQSYIAVEILKKLELLKWAEVRRLELKNKYENITNDKSGDLITEQEDIAESEKTETDSNNICRSILGLIRELDAGRGVEIGELIKKGNLNESEIKNNIESLLKKGDIFELRPGVLKVLE